MEAIGATDNDAMEVVATSDSSDELTYMLMKEKKKAKAFRKHTANPASNRRTIRSKVIKDGFETAHRNRTALNDEDSDVEMQYVLTELMTPVRPTRSSNGAEGSSPGGTATTGSEESVSEVDKEDTFENSTQLKPQRSLSRRAKQRVSSMKTFFRKTKLSRVPRRIETRNATAAGAGEILRDLDGDSLLSTTSHTVRHRNTGGKKNTTTAYGDDDATVAILKRATRYKKKAQRLLREANSKENDEKETSERKDSRDTEAEARKAYRYAAESRRLYDIVGSSVKIEATAMVENSATPSRSSPLLNFSDMSVMSGMTGKGSITSSPNVNVPVNEKGSASKRAERSRYSTSMFDEEDTVTAQTTFSQKVDRDEHKRKMKELELFRKNELRQFSCAREDGLGSHYAAETERIIDSLDTADISDNASVMTFMTVMSTETTASEHVTRKEHQTKMQELELFSASNMWSSMIQSFSAKKVAEKPIPAAVGKETKKKVEKEKMEGIVEDFYEDDESSDGDVESLHMTPICSVKCNDGFNNDDYTTQDSHYFNDDETTQKSLRYNHSVDDYDDAFSDDSTDESGSGDDDDSNSSDGESDDDSQESDRGIFQRWFDGF